MGKFTDKCKKFFGRNKSEQSDDKGPKKPRTVPNLLKKKNRKVSPTFTISTLVNTPPTEETAEDPSTSPVHAVNEPSTAEDHPPVQTSVSPPTTHSGEEEPAAAQEAPPAQQSSDENTPSDSQGASSSGISNATDHSTSDVYELPGSLTLQDATAHPVIKDAGPKSLNDAEEKEERRRGEAKFWGPMLSETHERYLDDGLWESGVVASSRPLPNQLRSSALVVTPAASTTKLPSISQILRRDFRAVVGLENGLRADIATNPYDLSTTLAPIRGLTLAADFNTTPSSPSQSSNAAVDGPMSLTRILNPDVPDDESVKSDSASAWKSAYEASEKSHQDDIEELRDGHAAEVAKLQGEVEAAVKRKKYVLEMTHEKLAIKDKDIATKDAKIEQQGNDLLGLDAENYEKDQKIAEMEAKIKHLAARTSSMVDQDTHRQVCEERDISRAELETVRQKLQRRELMHNGTIQNLTDAEREVTRQELKLRDRNYFQEEADDDRRADKDAACERCKGLEKDVDDAYQLWKDARKRHEEEKIRLQGKAQENQNEVHDLESRNNFNESEIARLTEIVDNFIANNQKQRSRDENLVNSILEIRSKASLKTIMELKQEREWMDKHIKSAEKKNSELNVNLSVREMILNNKEAEIIDANEAQNEVQIKADELSWKLETAEDDHHQDTQHLQDQLAHAHSINEDLQRHIQSMLSSGFGVADPETLHRYQTEVGQLKHHIMQLEEANNAHRKEQIVQRELNIGYEDCAAASNYYMAVDRSNYDNALKEIEELKRKMGDMQQGRDPRVFDMMRENAALEKRASEVKKKLVEKVVAEKQKINCLIQSVDILCTRLVNGQDYLPAVQDTLHTLHSMHEVMVEEEEEQHAEVSNAAVDAADPQLHTENDPPLNEEEVASPDHELNPNPHKTNSKGKGKEVANADEKLDSNPPKSDQGKEKEKETHLHDGHGNFDI
ncbi:MAG: hypothetical protein Q9212_003524, partial [Teloschistes hypoglaucus]